MGDQVRNYYEGNVEPIYRTISGSILHLGIFKSESDSYLKAKERTKPFLASQIDIRPEHRVLDLGSGYGNSARYLAGTFGCRVLTLNLVHVQNQFSVNRNQELGIGEKVMVLEGDFTHVPIASGSLDVVWSQEAFLHAEDPERVIGECARALKPGGRLLFTDILQTGEMAPEEARKIYERVKVSFLARPQDYVQFLAAGGLALEAQVDLSENLPRYYSKLSEHLAEHRGSLDEVVGPDYVDYTLNALNLWVQAGKAGKLGWGLFLARKP